MACDSFDSDDAEVELSTRESSCREVSGPRDNDRSARLKQLADVATFAWSLLLAGGTQDTLVLVVGVVGVEEPAENGNACQPPVPVAFS